MNAKSILVHVPSIVLGVALSAGLAWLFLRQRSVLLETSFQDANNGQSSTCSHERFRVVNITPRRSDLHGGTKLHVTLSKESVSQRELTILKTALVEGRLWCKFDSFAATSKSKVHSLNVNMSQNVSSITFQCVTPNRGCADLCTDPQKHSTGAFYTVTKWPKVDEWPAMSWVDIIMLVDSSHVSHLLPYRLEGPSQQFLRVNSGPPGKLLFYNLPKHAEIKLNVAHGSNLLKGWVNMDTEPAALQDEDDPNEWILNVLWTGDFLFGGFEDNSVSIINLAHTLIYFNAGLAEQIVHEAYRVLRVGGILRVSEDTPFGKCPCPKSTSTSCESDTLSMFIAAGFDAKFLSKGVSSFPDRDIFKLYRPWAYRDVNSPLFVIEGTKLNVHQSERNMKKRFFI